MPIFEYRCPACAQDFELLIRAADHPACPQCGSGELEKLLSAASAPAAGRSPLPIANAACPPGNLPCSPTCCRLP